jgi:histidinol phosphatase-like enzyme (inositol monophosphatase family)
MNSHELNSDLEHAVELAERAGPIAASYFRSRVEVENKSKSAFDPVTIADREVEAFVRAELRSRFPGDTILGEEMGEEIGEEAGEEAGQAARSDVGQLTQRRWVIDPIDGTRAFITGMPAWGILLGLQESQVPVLGVMHQPFTGETFFGAQGAAAKLRQSGSERTITTRRGVRLADAVLYCTHPDIFSEASEREAFERVSRTSRMTRFGGDCYAYCLLALGQIDLVIEAGLNLYDIVPLIPIIEAAGGVVTDAVGGSAAEGGFIVAAGSPELHAETLRVLRAG